MITSMSQAELYKTLVGHYKPNYNSATDSSRSAEKSVDKADILRNAVGVEDLPVYKDLTNEPLKDRFVFSENAYQTYDVGTAAGENKVIAYECTDAIDFGCTDIRAGLESGYTNGLVTKERIAEFYGAMAKRLDEAYKEGKFTGSEYGELSEMIEMRVEKQATLTERLTASYALGRERGSLSPAAAKEAILRKQSMTSEEFMAEQDKLINEYVEKYFKIDRTSLMQLFNSCRYGK